MSPARCGALAVVQPEAGFSKSGGTSQRSSPDGVTVPHGRYTLLMVHDTGSGMDEGTRARIWWPV